MTYKQCTQTKCIFLITGQGCPVCAECFAGERMLNAEGNCVNCHCCEADEGYIRKGTSTQKHTITIEIGLKNNEQDKEVQK